MCGYFGSEKIICKQVEISYYIMCIKSAIVLYFSLPPTLHLCSLLSISNIIVFSTHSPPPKTLFLRLRLRLCLSLHSFHILFLFASRARKYLHKLQCLKINPSCRGRAVEEGGMVGRSVGRSYHLEHEFNKIKNKNNIDKNACVSLSLFVYLLLVFSFHYYSSCGSDVHTIYMGIVCMYV